MSVVKEERYAFKTEWFDKQAELIRHYLFTFYPKDNSVEMVSVAALTTVQYDLKNKRIFMKRNQVEGISVRELFIGSQVSVNSRQLKLVDYADIFTQRRFENSAGRTFAMVKPDCYTQTGKIMDAIYQSGFTISKLKMSKFS